MGWLDQVGISLTQLSIGLKVEAELGNRMLLFLTICFVTPSLSNFFQKKGLTSPSYMDNVLKIHCFFGRYP